ncbi:gliding motility-associated peptidyl-prolyl isomerase GldI [Psychroflexus sp. ALD_RP9]|uniref:gliding motility-associated peptidyl-prolyl isomerase GldI n=1 Tax=Psychroflexus sp. ALD_RP9 TaxID=2777186 RepID=UPI001A8FD52E|nr:gliding motility-associated peptidyl-prolyl isomerase GldI [Psychroflexus sp. ALD_RP9]QSS97184.1 gliding motility-associated peptidyl-prolyl isomerase GldI [Psychroflexus sp. ALD_RP9]
MTIKQLLASTFIILLAFSCKTPEARKPISKSSDSFIKQSININKAVVKREESLIKAIIKKDSTRTYFASKNGFWYTYNKKNNTDTLKPGYGDEVEFNFNILSLDNDTIYSRSELGERALVIDKENIFSGLRQGLKLMKVNETVTFLFPSHKVYGYYGDNQRIGKNIPVKSVVTLNKINTDETLTN